MRKTYFEICRCPDCDDCQRAEKLSQVTITLDAFERAANGQGGYETAEKTLKISFGLPK